MIAYLQGKLLEIQGESVVLKVNGVGYELVCSQNTIFDIEGQDFLELRVHTHVREDALQLYGFSQLAEKELFLSLLKVNGVGPKLAIKILSGAPLAQVISMIDQGDVKGLSKLPKVGKKTAEQMILSLKGKLKLHGEAQSELFSSRDEIISALTNLGFRLQDVEKAVKSLPPTTDLQSGVREGLKLLTSP